MNDEQLQKLTEQLSLQYFHKPFLHKAFFNRRLRTIGGRYMLVSHNIEINYRYFEQYGMDEIIGIVKHELCHYHLHLEKRGYKHRDRDFKLLLKEVGAPRFCTPLKKAEAKKKRVSEYLYECKSCQTRYIRKRNINLNKYVCGVCRGTLQKIKG
ncbi:SprT family protein [Bacillus sp. AGMB 02131]|uniref:Protein SprT-like n=1 Tax=Peribacillus faecalis TaxID=2772559 RepID=A0A927HC69_9BACI|nr:SprT family protein [Peribacillus faecalis]MBD3109704.1 SprT family protein [Peribacillus faecalis]